MPIIMPYHSVLWAVMPVVCLACTACVNEPRPLEAVRPLPSTHARLLPLPAVKEPSGICYHTTRTTLFVVDDSGGVCEVRPDGAVVAVQRIRKADFEGITHDPASGLLYIAAEGDEQILEVDPAGLRVLRECAVPRVFQGRTVMKEGGQGIEGITFVPNNAHPHGGTFFVANQSFDLNAHDDLSAIFELEVPIRDAHAAPDSVAILRCITPGVPDISGLHWDASRQRLFAISDSANLLMAFTRAGTLVRAWSLPGSDQEGITIGPDGTLYIAQDSGGILVLAIDWRTM